MRIVVVYKYSIEELAGYLASRMPPGLYVPLAAFLAAAAFAATNSAIAWQWLWAVWLALLLVLQFRLWDDIADLEFDRIHNPDRVLCRTVNLHRFYYVGGALALINGVLIGVSHEGLARIGGFVTLCLAVLAWYRWRPRDSGYLLLNAHVILLKYPAIVWLITPESVSDKWLNFFCCLVSVYLVFSIYEILHDERLRMLRGIAWLLVTQMILVTSTWVLVALEMRESATLGFMIVWAGVVSASVLLGAFHLFRMRQRPTPSVYGYFVIGLIAYLGLSLETNQ